MYHGSLRLDQRNSFVKKLQQEGYMTIGVHSNPWITYLQKYDKGFDIFLDSITNQEIGIRHIILQDGYLHSLFKLLTARCLRYMSDKSINQKIKETLNEHKISQPLFLWTHYMNVHDPYFPKNNYNFINNIKFWHLNSAWHVHRDMNKDDVEKLKEIYKAKIIEVDQSIEYLLDILSEKLDFEKTWIILTSDHGQGFLEHGLLGHGFLVYEELVRVPLLISGPMTKAKLNSSPISLIDLAPTILEIAKTEPLTNAIGRSILKTQDGIIDNFVPSSPIFIHSSLHHFTKMTDVNILNPIIPRSKLIVATIQGGLKYIYNHNRVNELYDLHLDPNETHNLREHHVKENTLRESVERHIMTMSQTRESERTIYDERNRIKEVVTRLKRL
jgi:arylsulfatase A-like enzyme